MAIKASLLFEGTQRVCGWSETLYSISSSLSDVQTLLTARIPIRLALSPSSVKIVGWRMNLIGSNKTSRTANVTTANTGTFNGETDMTEPWTALLMRRRHNDQLKTPWYMHGLPQSQVLGGTLVPTGPWSTALGVLLADDEANWKIYAKDPLQPANPKAIFSITLATAVRLTSHQIGRPFNLLVGRRLAFS